MNMSAINEARNPSYGRRLAMACGAVFGAMVMVGPALGADLPFNNYYPNDYSYQDNYNYPPQQNCCGFYQNPCCCCDYHDAGGRWWGPPAVNVHVNVPWERRREGGWVSRKYTERRYSDDSPYAEFRQYRSVQRYSSRYDEDEDLGRFGPYPSEAAYERRDAYRYEEGALPYPPRRPFYDEPFDRPPAPVPGGW